ncbi:MAG TPA: carbohydrate kinase family protein [Pseudonocardiaceae bacterium]
MIVVVGDAGMDVLVRHTKPITPGTDQPADVRTAIGGAGANTCAWLARLGATPTLVGRVGDDPAGRLVAGELTAAGVECVLAVDPEAGTCWVVVLVDGHGQRAMLSDRGAGRRLRPADLPPGPLADARHLHLSGYVLLDPASRPAGTAMLAAARDAGLTTSVDPQGVVPITDPAGFLDLVRGVDLLLPNADELVTLTGSPEPESATALLDAVGAVAVTRGAAGASWVDDDGVLTEPAERVECVDTTGAGDAFNAALLHARLAGSSPREALRAGVTAGSAAVRFVGAQPPVRRR